jgi:hypothetical protein
MINPYATLSDLKTYLVPRGQSSSTTVDTVDDVEISEIIEGVCRYIDDQTHRTFYPRYETRYFDVPVYQNSPRNLFLDDDLLEVVTVTNGDTTVISPTVFNLKPKNYSPHYAIQIVGPAAIFWIFNGIGSIEKVISVEAWWGFHNKYEQRAWKQVGTLGAAITDTTTLTPTMTAGHTTTADSIVKIDKEIMNVAAIATTTFTAIQRGDNGSTAATHLINAPVYQWMVQPEIREAVKQISQSIYQARSGQVSSGKMTVTSAGIVIRPEDIPPLAAKTIQSFTRLI